MSWNLFWTLVLQVGIAAIVVSVLGSFVIYMTGSAVVNVLAKRDLELLHLMGDEDTPQNHPLASERTVSLTDQQYRG